MSFVVYGNNMRFFRKDRVASLIREELGKIVLEELEFPGAIATLTEVEVEKKLDYAKVKVSVYPSEKADEVLREFVKRVGHLQHLLNRKLNIKPMPRISFVLDRGPELAARVEKALLKEQN